MNRQWFNAQDTQYATPEVSGDGLVSWESGKKCVIPSVRLYGAAVQDGTPTPDNPIMPACNNGVFAAHGDTILGTTQLNTSAFGWTKNADAEFGENTAYYYHEIQAKPNTTYTFIAPYARPGVGTSYFTAICANRNVTGKVPIYNANNAASCNTVGAMTTDDTGMLYLVTVSPTGAANVLRAFWLTEYDGGQAQAPELWAIPGTEYRDEWDPQSGRGIRRVKQYVLTASDVPKSVVVGDNNIVSFNVNLPANATSKGFAMQNAFGNITKAVTIGSVTLAPWQHCAYSYYAKFSFDGSVVGTTAEDVKAWLTAQSDAGAPVIIWYALAESEPFYSPPAKLTMPTGYGQIIQVGGDIPDCPITAKYLTHR